MLTKPARLPFDSLTLAAVADSLQVLRGGRIQHIRQSGEHDIVLSVYRPGQGEAHWLISCATQWARTYLVGRRPANLPEPPPFCRALRKWLQGGHIESITQRRFDRVLDVAVRGHEGQEFLLSTELMGRHSNIILIGPDGQVRHAAKMVSSKESRFREVLPGREYLPPPTSGLPDPRSVSRNEFLAWLHHDRPEDAAAWLGDRFEGVSRFLAQAIVGRAGPALAAETLWEAFDAVFDAARRGAWEPVLVRDAAGVALGAYPLPILDSRGDASTVGVEPSQSEAPESKIDELLERYYDEAIPRALVAEQRRSLDGALRKALASRQHSLSQVEQGTRERGRSEQYRRHAELILAHLHQIPRRVTAVELPDYYADDADARVTVALDEEQTPQQNAERLFRRARHVEENAERMLQLQQQLSAECAALQATLAEVEEAATTEAVERLHARAQGRGWLSGAAPHAAGAVAGTVPAEGRAAFGGKRVRAHTSPEGYQVLVGENAEANDYLVQKVAQSNDWWLHVRAGTSAHVVVRTGNAPLRMPLATLQFAARLAAAHSPGKHAGLVAVDYVLRKHVRRPRNAAPGMVTYTHEKTLHVAAEEVW